MNKRLAKGAALAAVLAMGLGVAKAWAHDAAVHQKKAERRRGRLGLSPEQREKLKLAGKERREAVRPLREKLRSEQKALREMLHAGASDKELEAAMTRIAALKKKISAKNDELRAKADALLTPRQRAMMAMSTRRRHPAAWRSRHDRFAGEGEGRWRR